MLQNKYFVRCIQEVRELEIMSEVVRRALRIALELAQGPGDAVLHDVGGQAGPGQGRAPPLPPLLRHDPGAGWSPRAARSGPAPQRAGVLATQPGP